MATLSKAFLSESERVHHDHATTLNELTELELALERLDCHSEVYKDLRAVEKVQEVCLRLASELPDHCRREEAMVHMTVAEVSTELAEFAGEMRMQHAALISRLNALCVALDELPNSFNLARAVEEVRNHGLELVREMRRHISTEEHTLSGFL